MSVPGAGGGFLVLPFNPSVPPRKASRTELKWRAAGLLPPKPGEPDRAPQRVAAAARRSEVAALLRKPCETRQRAPLPRRSLVEPLKPPTLKPAPVFANTGGLTLGAGTWEAPIGAHLPQVDPADLKRARAHANGAGGT